MKLSAIAAAVALSLPLTAFADATATAQIGNFRYEVIDLDLPECYEMMSRFIEENPALWNEDIGR